MGSRALRQAADRPGALRAGVPHVLPADALATGATGVYRASPRARHSERVPLPAAPSFGDGTEIRGPAGRLSRGGSGERPARAPPLLPRTPRIGADTDREG